MAGDGVHPKLALTQTLPPDSLEVWVDATVYRAYDEPGKEADSFKTFRRLVGMRGPDAQAQVSTCCNRLVTAIRKKGPTMTYEDLLKLAWAWERGELDVH